MLTDLARPADSDWDAIVMEWLAGLFLAPVSFDVVISYREGLGATLLAEMAQQPRCLDGIQTMRAALAVGTPAAVLTRTFEIAFMQLFEGVGGPRTVSPFESVHVSPRSLMSQAPARDMDLLLTSAGLQVIGRTREPADHLSVELALLAAMMRTGRQQQQAALLDRLLRWVPDFADTIDAADPSGFYAGAASVLAGFLAAQRHAIHGQDTALALPFLTRADQYSEGTA